MAGRGRRTGDDQVRFEIRWRVSDREKQVDHVGSKVRLMMLAREFLPMLAGLERRFDLEGGLERRFDLPERCFEV